MTRQCLGILLSGCMAWSVCAWAGQDEEAVEGTLRAAVTAAAMYSDTGDKQAVLNLYADDYEGIQDGQTETKAAIEQWLVEYDSELKQGNTLRFIGGLSNLRLHRVEEATAWATYDYVFQAFRRGELEGEDAGKCTSLLRKHESRWLIFHEHCSKARAR